MIIEENGRQQQYSFYIFAIFPPKDAPISFVCMYFASTKYILHVKQDSLLVEPFVLYQVLIAIIHFKLVRVFITVDFKLCLMRSYKYCCEITFFFVIFLIILQKAEEILKTEKKGLRVVQNCKSSLLMVAIAQVKEWIRPL